MTSTKKRTIAKRLATTATYYNYGVSQKTATRNANYANFVASVAFVVGIYLIARFFGL
jgi:hypothetical protein